MMFSLASPALATDNSKSTEQQISSIYGIPSAILDELPDDICASLTDSLDGMNSFSVEDTYIKITHTDDGESIAESASYEEYLTSTTSPSVNKGQHGFSGHLRRLAALSSLSGASPTASSALPTTKSAPEKLRRTCQR